MDRKTHHGVGLFDFHVCYYLSLNVIHDYCLQCYTISLFTGHLPMTRGYITIQFVITA